MITRLRCVVLWCSDAGSPSCSLNTGCTISGITGPVARRPTRAAARLVASELIPTVVLILVLFALLSSSFMFCCSPRGGGTTCKPAWSYKSYTRSMSLLFHQSSSLFPTLCGVSTTRVFHPFLSDVKLFKTTSYTSLYQVSLDWSNNVFCDRTSLQSYQRINVHY